MMEIFCCFSSYEKDRHSSGFCRLVLHGPMIVGPVLGVLFWALLLGVGHAEEHNPFQVGSGERVTMDFQEVDLREVIRFVSEMVGKNYVVDPAVKGKVTVITPNPVTIEEAEKIFASILSVQGLTVVKRDGAFKIVPEKDGRRESNATFLPEEQLPHEQEAVVSRLVRVQYVASGALANTLKPLMHTWGSLTAHVPSNSLIVADTAMTVERIVRLAQAMDVPPEFAVHRLFSLRYASVAQMEKLINSVFSGFNRRKRKSDPEVKVLSDSRTNTLVVVAPKAQLHEVKRLLTELDRPVHSTKGDLHLYYPKNGKAEVIAKVLNDLISKAQTGGKESVAGLKPLEFLRQVNVVGEKESNTLVIAATKKDYEILLPILEGLDMRRLQVHVEALILEVSAERSIDFGIEWGLGNLPSADSTAIKGFGGSTFGYVGNPLANPLASGGLALGLMRGGVSNGAVTVPNLAALLRAVQGDSDINVLATPNIMTMDNEQAEIVSGENVPILTGTTQSTNTTTTYDRKDVGLTLRITPQVVEDGWLRLKIFQEQSSIAPSSNLGEGNVVTKKRSIQTVVTLKSGQMVVLGGLIDEKNTGEVQQVPCLGGVFGLGELFKTTNRSKKKTNLMVFINPTIINTYSDLLGISEDKFQASKRFWERNLDEDHWLEPSLKLEELPSALNPPPEIEPMKSGSPLRYNPLALTP